MANFVKGHFLITILATIAGLFIYFFLHLERSWEIVLVVGLAVLAMLVSRRKNLIERAQETCLQKPKFSISVFFVAAVVIIFALRSEHFALLMLTTVLLYITVCFGLTAQFGFVGLVNFCWHRFFWDWRIHDCGTIPIRCHSRFSNNSCQWFGSCCNWFDSYFANS